MSIQKSDISRQSFVVIALTAIVATFLMGCANPSEKLAARVGELSDSIPKEIARGLSIQDIGYDGNNLILTYAVDEDYYDVSAIADNLNPAAVSEIVETCVTDGDGKLITDSKCNILCIFKGTYGNECSIVIDPVNHTSTMH